MWLLLCSRSRRWCHLCPLEWCEQPFTREKTVAISRMPARLGGFVVRDLRRQPHAILTPLPTNAARPSLRVCTWNIQRGYRLDVVLEYLKRLDPDILFLQEVDIALLRSGNCDVGAEIATALSMNYMFALQYCPKQWGHQGYYGDAILTKYDFVATWACTMPRVRHWKWKGAVPIPPKRVKQGGKEYVCPAATIATPLGNIDCWCVHLDAYTGIRGRVAQIQAVLDDCKRVRSQRFQQAQPEDKQDELQSMLAPAIIAGDFNTVGHGYKRLLPMFCNDDLRWRSVGQTEPQWWQENVLRPAGFHDPSFGIPTLKVFGGLAFSDKLDWILVSKLRLLDDDRAHIQVAGRGASDHMYVCMDLVRE